MKRVSAGAVQLRRVILDGLSATKGRLTLAALCLLGVSLTELLAPWPLKFIFDHVLLGRPLTPGLAPLETLLHGWPNTSLIILACSIAFIALINGSLSYVQIHATTAIGHQLVHRLRRELFNHLTRLSLSFHNRARSGELLTQVATDTSVLRDALGEWTLTLGTDLLTLAGMLAIMFTLNWKLSLVVVATLPLLFAVLVGLNRKIKLTARRQRHQEGRLASRLSEVLASMPLVQAFGQSDYEKDRFESASEESLEAGIQTSRTAAAVNKAIAAIIATGTAVTVLVGAWLVREAQMSPGDLLVFVAYVGRLYRPVRDLGRLSVRFSRAAVSAQRISEILAIEPDIRDLPDAIAPTNLRGEIVFRNVSFSYDGSTKVLEHVSFRIAPGQRVALVGTSGSGKSTIVSLLLRLYEPQHGGILIDGVDIRRYRRESLRRQIGLVLQDTVLFGASIRDNIAYGKPDATPAEIEEAARQAHAHDFIVSLADGYDTPLGERGATLSGGQRQRICLARALIKRPSILVLDEPTSAVDPMSASLIEDAVGREARTALVIAHRFGSMSQFDQILVLKDGAIVECGHHDRLIASRGHYAELAGGRWA